MITQEQIDKLCGNKRRKFHVLAVLTENYKPIGRDYTLLKGVVVKVAIFKHNDRVGMLLINGRIAETLFPLDAAELLDDN